jgi:hypothetical protein
MAACPYTGTTTPLARRGGTNLGCAYRSLIGRGSTASSLASMRPHNSKAASAEVFTATPMRRGRATLHE